MLQSAHQAMSTAMLALMTSWTRRYSGRALARSVALPAISARMQHASARSDGELRRTASETIMVATWKASKYLAVLHFAAHSTVCQA